MAVPPPAAPRWTLEDLVDFEHALTAPDALDAPVDESLRARVRAANRELPHAAARRAGLRWWLERRRPEPGAGRAFTRALGAVATLLGAATYAAGAATVFGMLDRGRGGIHAVWFLATTLGSQALLLLAALAAFVFRRRVGGGFSLVQALVGALVRRFAGQRRPPWWERATQTASSLRPALLWPLARVTQEAAVCFNLGLLTGLAALVLFRHIGFYWESTTESALQQGLETTVGVLSAPWRAFLPDCVPDLAATRWRPDRAPQFLAHARGWWTFLLLAIACWGLLPRLALLVLARALGRRALARLDFQERHHRALWRHLTEANRNEPVAGPADGALVLDLGGSGIDPEGLRPFLLRRLRVHPVAWHPLAVLDPEREAEAKAALRRSPAGVVVLAEGWALSPPRLRALHAQIRRASGPQAPLTFLVANAAADRSPLPPAAEELAEWTRFTDSLQDPATDLVPFAPVEPLAPEPETTAP